MFNLYDVVKLKKDRHDIGINEKDKGAIIDIIENGKAYTVEFFDENDETIEESIYQYFVESDLVLVEPYNNIKLVNLELASGK